MAATAGRSLRVKVATTTGGVYSTVVGIANATMSRQGQTVDVTTLTDSDIVRILGIRDCTFTIDGNWESADTTGQDVIRSAYENDTALFVQFLPNGTAGFKQEVKVSKFEIAGASGAGKVSISIELQGTGAVSTV